MRQFDLEPPFGRCGALAEDFEDQPGAIDDLRPEGGFEVALLDRTERGVDDDKLDALCGDIGRDRVDLPDPEQGRGARLAQAQRVHRDDVEPDREREPLRFLGARVKVAREALAMPLGHDDKRGGAARYLVFRVDYRVDQASSASPSASPLSVRLIGPFG
jgi:hypothetical protein